MEVVNYTLICIAVLSPVWVGMFVGHIDRLAKREDR